MKTKNHSKNDQTSNPQTDPQQKRSVMWIGVILFISGWIFFLGVIVGRGTAPALFDYKKIEAEITTLAKTFTDSRKVQNDTETDILTTQVGLEYPEELKKKTDNTVRMQIPALENPARPAEMPKPAQQAPAQAPPPPPAKSDFQTAGKPEPIEHAPDAIKPGPEVKIKSMYDLKTSQARETAQERTLPPTPERAPVAAPERTPVAIPKPQPPPPAASENKVAAAQPVTVQMSSLLDRKSADELIVSLRSKGISASKTPKMVPGKGVWYMVVIGKYANSTEADAMLNRLRQENVDASLVKQ